MSQQADGQEVAWVSKDGHLRLVFRGQTSAILGSGIVAPLYDLEELDEHAGPLVLEPGQGRDLDVEVRLQLLVLQKLVVGEVDLTAGLLDPVVQVIEAGLG